MRWADAEQTCIMMPDGMCVPANPENRDFQMIDISQVQPYEPPAPQQ